MAPASSTLNPTLPPVLLTGYALIGKTPFITILDPLTGFRYGLSTSPDFQNNHIVEFHQRGSSLSETSGIVSLHNQTRVFRVPSSSPTDHLLHSENDYEGEEWWHEPHLSTLPMGSILLYPDSDFHSQGRQEGLLAALQTLVLMETLSINNPNIFLHLHFHPLPPHPTEFDLRRSLYGNPQKYGSTQIPLLPVVDQSHQEIPPTDPHFHDFYRGYQEGWISAFDL